MRGSVILALICLMPAFLYAEKIKVFNDTAGTLYMDGEEVGDIGVNEDKPYVIPGVDAGTHVLKLQARGSKPINREVTVKAGENKTVRLLTGSSGGENAASEASQEQSGQADSQPEETKKPVKTVDQEIEPYVQDDSPILLNQDDGSAYREYLELSPKAKLAYLDYYDSQTSEIRTYGPFVLGGIAMTLGVGLYFFGQNQAAYYATQPNDQDEVSSETNLSYFALGIFGAIGVYQMVEGMIGYHDVNARNKASQGQREHLGKMGDMDLQIRPLAFSGTLGSASLHAPGLAATLRF